MIGKIIKVNDFKFVYGQDTMYITAFGAFKNSKNGEKYIVYSYDGKKIYYGSFFIKEKVGTIMMSKNSKKDDVKNFIDSLLSGKSNKEIEIINLDVVDSVQIIDEILFDLDVDVNKLIDITIPKSSDNSSSSNVVVTNKSRIFTLVIILILLILGIVFMIVTKYISDNTEEYICNKDYLSQEVPANVIDEVLLSFNYRNNLTSMVKRISYIFDDNKYYMEFKNKSYFYKYIDDADSYKFIDEEKTYRLFDNVDVENDFFLPKDKHDLLNYYRSDGYTCSLEEE